MCGRFEQSETREFYARALGVDTHGPEWVGGDTLPRYNLSPGRSPLVLHLWKGTLRSDYVTWGYRTPQETAEKKKPWINARIEKALNGRYFRHMFREGRVIIPAGGWFEWSFENGKKQPWYITRKDGEAIFMAGLSNFRPYTHQTVEVGFVIVTQDCEGGMVNIHDRRPVVLEPEHAWRWMDSKTSVVEAVHIAQTCSLPTGEFIWWKVSREVNRADLDNNKKDLLTPT